MWVWCPLTSGCDTGSSSFPYLGCQLKYQADVSTSYAPAALPDAWSRGPPTAFVSGAAFWLEDAELLAELIAPLFCNCSFVFFQIKSASQEALLCVSLMVSCLNNALSWSARHFSGVKSQVSLLVPAFHQNV